MRANLKLNQYRVQYSGLSLGNVIIAAPIAGKKLRPIIIVRQWKSNPKQSDPKAWAESLNKLKPKKLYLTGGEPSLYKYLPELISLLDRSIRLSMTSNLGSSFKVEQWTSNVSAERFDEIAFSFHPTQVSFKEFLDHWVRAHDLYGGNLPGELLEFLMNAAEKEKLYFNLGGRLDLLEIA